MSGIKTRMSSAPRRAPSAMACLLLCAAGCLGHRGETELLEARLRQQQNRADAYARDLAEAHEELQLARRDADLLRRQIADGGGTPLPSEFTEQLFEATGIRFNGLMTGGRDRDDEPGDETLVAVITPHDDQGDDVKLIGTIELEVLDMSLPESDRRIARWSFTPEQARGLWKNGMFSRGFQWEAAWPQAPGSEELLLHASLTAPDGRKFDATHPITITPPRPHTTPSIQQAHLESQRPPAEAAKRAEDEFEWAREHRPEPLNRRAEKPLDGLRTSDNWTDATIPTLR